MKPVSHYIKNAIRVKEVLTDSERYLAHLPPADNSSLKEEPLSEHLELVFKYFVNLCNENGLDAVIDKLVMSIITAFHSNNKLEMSGYLKQLFVDTIVFHDFGKVNENFQADRMNNKRFKNVPTVLVPVHGHSELGSFIYLVYHLEKIGQAHNLTDEDKESLSACAFFMVNCINLHHSAAFTEPIARLEKSIFINHFDTLSKYLDLYGVPNSKLAKAYFDNLRDAIDCFEFVHDQHFPLYALTKLNFSLLTASDYLATSEYMNGQAVNDLGLIDETLRKKVLHHAQSSHPYNTIAFDLADSGTILQNPTERSYENLNILRRNMAVRIIRTIRENKDERLFYLEAPTGGGKTNLSMLATVELLKGNPEINKVFYVFPFTTLITQTHKAIKETLGLNDDEVSLLYSKVGFQTTGEDDCYGKQKKDYLNNLFVHYPFCLLTHIRFFDILKSNDKETNYLLHRLANSIVIIDELQSYAPQHWDKMLYFIQQYAAAFNIHFILMSATLPRIDKLKLDLVNKSSFIDLLADARDYFNNPNFSGRVNFRFDYRDLKLTMEEFAQIVLDKSKQYAAQRKDESVFTIVEFIFKKSATEFYEALNPNFFDEIFVLSGTILEPRRREIINYLKDKNNRDKKVLLITTQVVEAGVDIDMDLGFKNISLIDSDEQLAGRVNRNVTKEACEVYLFKINEPSQLYRKDYRYSITRDALTTDEHADILKNKDFGKLYGLVLNHIDKLNGLKELQNFNSDYLPEIRKLDYKKIHDKFQIIEQKNLSIFVPLPLPKNVVSPEGTEEAIFSNREISFLSALGVSVDKKHIEGLDVWQAYKRMISGNEKDFIAKQINRKLMSGILSKFTFSIFANPKIQTSLKAFSFPADDYENELRGFDSCIYLAHYDKCYDYQKGLIESTFEDSENFIL